MTDGLGVLRDLMLADEREVAYICSELLTVITHGESPVETLNFNVVDVTVDRNNATITFEGVLSVNDQALVFPTSRFVELAELIAAPHSGDALAGWEQRRKRRVWPMPPGPS